MVCPVTIEEPVDLNPDNAGVCGWFHVLRVVGGEHHVAHGPGGLSPRNTKAINSAAKAPCQLSNTIIPPSILSCSGAPELSGGSICTVTLILWPGLTVEGLASAIHTNGLSSGSSCCGLEWAPQGPSAVACWAAGKGRDGLFPATSGPLLNKMRPIGRAAQMISSLFLTPGPVKSLRIPSNDSLPPSPPPVRRGRSPESFRVCRGPTKRSSP